MATILLPIVAGAWPQGYCPATYQDWLNTTAANLNAQLNGSSFYNYGDTKPAPEFQAYPWLRTTDMRWYYFSGVWKSPRNVDANERRWFAGTLTELITYDGGSAGAVTATTGPTWVEDTDAQGRSPMSPGTIPGTDPAVVLAQGQSYGSGDHTLTTAEGALGDHIHPVGLCNPASDDAYFVLTGTNTVPSYTGHYITGDGTVSPGDHTTANIYTLPAGTDGAGVTSSPFSIVHPVIGWYAIKPTLRQFYTVP